MIELKNVSLKYKNQDNYALKDISLKVESGECILFCGKSGCGKSSVLKIINGMIPDYYEGEITGTVSVNGINPQVCSLYDLSLKVGTVFQNPRTQFYTVNTTSEIAFGCENHGMPADEIKRRVDEVAEELHMEKLLNKNIFSLSGGEKQKIALASIYAMNPDVYVLDEPSSNLDFKAMKELADVINILKNKGKTIIIAEHRLWYLKDLVDRFYYLEEEKINRELTIEDIDLMTEEQRLITGLRNINFNQIWFNSYGITKSTHNIELRNITAFYKNNRVLNITSSKVSAGRVVGIIGNNGAGKTTFISTICGYLKRQGGKIYYDNQPLNKKRRVKQSFMVMQDVNHQLFTNRVYDEVTLGLDKVDNLYIDKILKRMDIDKLKDRHPMTLSGGQKQRVAAACAAACGKNIIVFDEPTSGLDYYHMVEISALIRNLVDNGKFIFVISHDYEFILRTCDAVLRIDNGEIVEDYELTNENKSRLENFFTI